MAVRRNGSPNWFVIVALLAAGVISLPFVMRVDSPNRTSSKLEGGDDQPSSIQLTNKEANRRLVVSLKSRQHIVAVYASPGGPQFGVSSMDGMALGTELSIGEFEDCYPDLYRMYNSSYARAGLSSGRGVLQTTGIKYFGSTSSGGFLYGGIPAVVR